ncbi:MAG TPA: phosphatase PAP2 family protein, partial [Burkholderiaceae bacterium]|nr:phosphatase PAP2 family protein [Burkholderiaceae bacterium]
WPAWPIVLAPGVIGLALAMLVGMFGNRELMRAINGHPVGPLELWGGGWEAASIVGLGLSVLLLVLLFGARSPRWLASSALAFITVGVSLHAVKLLAHMPRPAAVLSPQELHVFGPLLAGHNSMPSGHAASIFAFATTMMVAGPIARRRSPFAASAAVLALTLVVALSRVASGAHWPIDVAAGALLGWAGSLAAVALADRTPLPRLFARESAHRWLAVALVACAIALEFTPIYSSVARVTRDLLALAGVVIGVIRLAGVPLAWPPFARKAASTDASRLRRRALTHVLPAVLLALAAAIWLVHRFNIPVSLPAWLCVAAPAGLLLSYGLRAGRVHAELGALHGASHASCLRLTMIHNAALNLLPMRSGELAYPLLANRTLQVPVAEAAASLLWMRLQDLVVLGVLSLLAFLPFAWPGRVASASGVAAVAGLALWQLRRRVAAAPASGWRSALWQALVAAPRHSIAGWLYCAANWSLKLLVIGAILSTVTGSGWIAGTTGALGGELAGLWPVQAPAGLGSYEAGVWLGMTAFDASQPAARLALAALVAHAFVFGTAMAAGGLAVLSGGFGKWNVSRADSRRESRTGAVES